MAELVKYSGTSETLLSNEAIEDWSVNGPAASKSWGSETDRHLLLGAADSGTGRRGDPCAGGECFDRRHGGLMCAGAP